MMNILLFRFKSKINNFENVCHMHIRLISMKTKIIHLLNLLFTLVETFIHYQFEWYHVLYPLHILTTSVLLFALFDLHKIFIVTSHLCQSNLTFWKSHYNFVQNFKLLNDIEKKKCNHYQYLCFYLLSHVYR